MDYLEAIKRLANHANIPRDDSIAPSESMTFNLWAANKNSIFFNVEEFKKDIILCLEAVNRHVNGEIPSKTTSKKEIDRHIVLCVCLIVAYAQEYALFWRKSSRFKQIEIDRLYMLSWEISQAWCAVLHGDIDSLEDGILLEKKTKGL
jgi:hypothetical protein